MARDPVIRGPLIPSTGIPEASFDDFWDVPESIPGFSRYNPRILIEFLEFVSGGGLHSEWDEGRKDNPGRVQYKTILYQWGRHQSVATSLEMAYSMRVTALEDEAISVARRRERGEQTHEQMDAMSTVGGKIDLDTAAAIKKVKKSQDDSPNSRRVHLTGIMSAMSGAKTAVALLPLRRMGAALLAGGQAIDDEFKGATRRRVAQMALEMANGTLDEAFRIKACQLALVAVGEPLGEEPIDPMPYTFDVSGDNPAESDDQEDLDDASNGD
ncbi:MAG: hypothetical protein WCZ86_06245 [Desulfurivibrionaceae bacterium]